MQVFIERNLLNLLFLNMLFDFFHSSDKIIIMINKSKLNDPILNEHKKALNMTYATLIIAFLCMSIINIYAYFTIQKMSKISSTLSNSALNIKLEITSANLLFREIVSDISKKDMNAVWKILKSAKNYGKVLTTAGSAIGIDKQIADYKRIMVKCYKERKITKGSEKRIKEYNAKYMILMIRLTKLESDLKVLSKKKMNTFKILYIALFVNIIILFGFLIISFHKYSKKRQIAERDLSFAKTSLTTLFNSMDSIVLSINSEKMITQWNLAAEKHTSISSTEAIGQNVFDLFPMLNNYKVQIEKVYHTHAPIALYRERLTTNKDVVYNLSFNYTVGMNNIVIKIDDTTEQEHRDEKLRQSQKMRVVSNLISGLAHNFNNALGAIIGTISMMKFSIKSKNVTPEEISSNIEVIESSAEKAELMVQQLLSLSQNEPPELRPIDLNFVLRHLMKICENTLDKSIELNAELYSVKALVMADPKQIEQILLEACDNAATAMENIQLERKKEQLSLSVSLNRISPNNAYRKDHPLATADSYWAIDITDNGCGMDRDTVKKAFDPFYTTNKNATGLGLSVMSEIITMHDGFIEVRSSLTTGTIITIFLPEYMGGKGEKQEDVKPDNSEQIPLGEGLVMVVDDEEVMQKTASNILKKLGYTIITANDGEEAVTIFKERHEDIVLTLLDLSMPKLSGEAAYIQMKAIDPNLKVLIVSGLANEERIQDVMSNGANGFIKKPYSMVGLARDVKTTIS